MKTAFDICLFMRTAFDTPAFSFSAINYWSATSIEIRNSMSINLFKFNLKQFLRAGQSVN